MFRFVTLASLFISCHGFQKPARLQAWLKDAVPLKHPVSGGSRIVGGTATTIDKFPYTASLQHEWDDYRYDTLHYCTGGIVNRDWIVTTAECALLMKVENVTARVGTSYFHQGGTVHHIAEAVFHPQWSVNSDEYDIALLRLNDSLAFSDRVQPISLPKSGVKVPDAKNLTMASWGAVYFLGEMTTELQEITVPTITNELCATVWGNRITDKMFCSYKEYEGMCIGDTGAPAVADGVLIGIASFNYACSAYGYPTVYTDVSALVDWITETSGSPLTATASFYNLLAIAAAISVKMGLQ